MNRRHLLAAACSLAVLAAAPSAAHAREHQRPAPHTFTLAVIPDTQNYTDFDHQQAQGFAVDTHALLDDQLSWVADQAASRGGPVAFLTSVGDTWEHQSLEIDAESIAKGYSAIFNRWLAPYLAPSPLTASVELPLSRAAYQRVAGKLPFSVVPGDHDYDAGASSAPSLARTGTGSTRRMACSGSTARSSGERGR